MTFCHALKKEKHMNKLKILREIQELLDIYNKLGNDNEYGINCNDKYSYPCSIFDLYEVIHDEIHERIALLVPEYDEKEED